MKVFAVYIYDEVSMIETQTLPLYKYRESAVNKLLDVLQELKDKTGCPFDQITDYVFISHSAYKKVGIEEIEVED